MKQKCPTSIAGRKFGCTSRENDNDFSAKEPNLEKKCKFFPFQLSYFRQKKLQCPNDFLGDLLDL